MGGNIKRVLGKDTRGEIKVDPNIELQDYSGPLKEDLSFTDFSKKQLGKMYALAHHYNYRILRGYRDYIREVWGHEAVSEAQEVVWGNTLVDDAKELHMRFMNIKGNDIASLLKAIQMDITALPPNFDMTFEMPSEDRGFLTFNKFYGVTMMEPLGMNDELLQLCAMDPPAIGNSAISYHPDMRTRVLAFPPRESDDHVCCKWEFYYDPTAPKLTWFDGRE